jgi:hypothetical protein
LRNISPFLTDAFPGSSMIFIAGELPRRVNFKVDRPRLGRLNVERAVRRTPRLAASPW